MLYEIEHFYHLFITLWVEMKEKLKGRLLPHHHWNLNLDPSLDHVSQPSVGHVPEIDNHCGQFMFDREFVTQTILAEIKTIVDHNRQICKELKDNRRNIKCQKSSETNFKEDTIESIEVHNSSVDESIVAF